MAKQMYRIIDSRGRVYLPKELRLSLDLEAGSFVKLTEDKGNLRLRKIHLVELGDRSPEAVEEYVSAAAAAMPRKKQLPLPLLSHRPLPWNGIREQVYRYGRCKIIIAAAWGVDKTNILWYNYYQRDKLWRYMCPEGICELTIKMCAGGISSRGAEKHLG